MALQTLGGGLEGWTLCDCGGGLVIRRIGGLEAAGHAEAQAEMVIRRIGGLEVS